MGQQFSDINNIIRNIASKYVDLTFMFSEHTESPKHEFPGKRILNIGVLVNLGVDYKPFQAAYCSKRTI